MAEDIYASETHLLVRTYSISPSVANETPIYICANAHGAVIALSFMLSVAHARALSDRLLDACNEHEALLAAAKREHDAMERA